VSLASVVPTAPKRHPINGVKSFGIKHLIINRRHKANSNIIGGLSYELSRIETTWEIWNAGFRRTEEQHLTSGTPRS
jgi:hypothetical protein